jgi:thiosulfate reductase cytochrome b subunit
VHFFTAAALVSFFVVHIAAVIAAGPVNETRSMLTGWFVIKRERRS